MQAISVSSLTYYDKKVSDSYLDFLDLPQNQRFGLANQKCSNPQCTRKDLHYHIRRTTPETAYATGVQLWRKTSENSDPLKRGKIRTIKRVMNVVVEWECPSNPSLAIQIGLLFRTRLIKNGHAPDDLPLILSGAGIHIVINIPSIEIIDENHAVLINDAIASVVETHFLSLFLEARGLVEARELKHLDSIVLEGSDIARLLSGPGDWRHSLKPDDHASLKNGYLRSVYENQPLFRHEWDPLRTLILYTAEELNKKQEDQIIKHPLLGKEFDLEHRYTRQELKKYQRAFHLNYFQYDIVKAVCWRLDWYVEQKAKSHALPYRDDERTIDRSRLACMLYNMLARVTDIEFAFHFRHLVNEKSGNKFENEEDLKKDANRILSRFKKKDEDPKSFVRVHSDPGEFFYQVVSMITRKPEVMESGYETKEEFIARYTQVCEDHGIDPLGEKQVTSSLEKLGIIVERKFVEGKRIRVYTGIQFK